MNYSPKLFSHDSGEIRSRAATKEYLKNYEEIDWGRPSPIRVIHQIDQGDNVIEMAVMILREQPEALKR